LRSSPVALEACGQARRSISSFCGRISKSRERGAASAGDGCPGSQAAIQ
jgi:hypothetical protein